MGKLNNFNTSLNGLNNAQVNKRGREAEQRKEVIREMVYTLRTNKPLDRPFPTKQEVRKIKGFSARFKAATRQTMEKKNSDLVKLYEDYNSGAIDKENALAYLEAQL